MFVQCWNECFYFCYFREYYFSEQNLQKDIFLRRQVWWFQLSCSVNLPNMNLFCFSFLIFDVHVHLLFCLPQMDPEGFIPLALIASFYRVQALTQDFNFILEVCKQRSLCTYMYLKMFNKYLMKLKENFLHWKPVYFMICT